MGDETFIPGRSRRDRDRCLRRGLPFPSPTREEVIGSRRRGERDRVLDRIRRGVALGVDPSAEVVGNGIGNDLPTCGKGLISRRSGVDLPAVRPAREGIARAGRIGERDRVLDRISRGVSLGVRPSSEVISDRVAVDRAPLCVDVHIRGKRRVEQGVGGERARPRSRVPIPAVEIETLFGRVLRKRDHRVPRGIDGAEDRAVHDKVQMELHLVVSRHDDHDGIGVPGRCFGQLLRVAFPLGVDVHIARQRRVEERVGGKGLVPLARIPIPTVELVALFGRVLGQCDGFLSRRVDGSVDLPVYDKAQFELDGPSARGERQRNEQDERRQQNDSPSGFFHWLILTYRFNRNRHYNILFYSYYLSLSIDASQNAPAILRERISACPQLAPSVVTSHATSPVGEATKDSCASIPVASTLGGGGAGTVTEGAYRVGPNLKAAFLKPRNGESRAVPLISFFNEVL